MRRVLLMVALLALPNVAAAQQSETVEYYGQDLLGSVRIVWDAAGNRLARQDFTPFGQPLSPVPAIPAQTFTGQEADTETNQAYFHARMLEARTGRFAAADPIGGNSDDPQTWNRYAYALNRPLEFTDPTGMTADPCAGTDYNTGTCVVGNPTNPDWDWSGPSCRWPCSGWYTGGGGWGVPEGGNGGGWGPGANNTTSSTATTATTTSRTEQPTTPLTGKPPKNPPPNAPPPSPDELWRSAFWRSLRDNLLYGVRGDRDFLDCFNQNVVETSGGRVNPERLFDLHLNQAEALAAFATTAQGGSFNIGGSARPVSVATQFLRWGTGAIGLTGGVRVGTVVAGSAALKMAAGFGAATLGVAMGSAWNCRP